MLRLISLLTQGDDMSVTFWMQTHSNALAHVETVWNICTWCLQANIHELALIASTMSFLEVMHTATIPQEAGI